MLDTATQMSAQAQFLPFKQRNAALDSLFYDTTSLSPEETARLSPLVDREGSIIVVPPTGSDRPIRHYKRALRFMNKEGDAVRAMAVTGVGSSVLGTAALARNVADAIGADVAGVVTGYGMTDLISEALGGWFVFGAADRARLHLERAVERSTAPLPEARHASSSSASLESLASGASGLIPGLPGNPDVTTLVDILTARPKQLEFLVGHSKGCLLIDFVLEQFVEELEGDDHPLYDRLKIITLGAVVDLPRQFGNVRQYLGALDWFGGMNSRLHVAHERIPNAWHHLNRSLPYHLDAVATLKRAVDG